MMTTTSRNDRWWVTLYTIILLIWSPLSSAQSADQYRQVLLGFADILTQTSTLSGREGPLANIEMAVRRLEQIPDDELLNTIGRTTSLIEMQSQLELLRSSLVQARMQQHTNGDQRSNTRSSGIDIPDVTVEPSFCEYATGTISVIELAAWKVLKEIFAATEFTCLQTVAGTNLAGACATIAVLTVTAELSYENASFCLNEQRAAKGETILELDRNIGVYLNTFLDDTTTSSRATQDSIDTLQTDITTAMTSINTIQDDLDSGFTTISDDLNDTLQDLSTVTTTVIDLISQADDIQLRIQASQVDIEDIQTRTADLQESTDEIRTDTQSIISQVSTLQSDTRTLLTTLNNGFDQVNQDAIAAALSNPDFGIAEYALPEEAGGQLETAREVLIQAILSLNSLGIGDTITAVLLLSQGDLAYNQQNYPAAYLFFAQAYQALTAPTVVR